MNGVLETFAYQQAVMAIGKVMEFCTSYRPEMDKQLGPIHEQALNEFEHGQMTEVEFKDIRARLRNIGMTELWY